MNIAAVEIRNFRKLKACRIDLSKDKTVFVGANNSGKTSAMDAMIVFMKRNCSISTMDITLSNWRDIDSIGKSWLDNEGSEVNLEPWGQLLPTMDLWLNVEQTDLYLVSHLIPTLARNVDCLGVRLRFEPKDIHRLYGDFLVARRAAQDLVPDPSGKPSLWPKSLRDFLDQELNNYFEIRAYMLDPVARGRVEQPLVESTMVLEGNPFNGLFRVDVINAQRGFSDVNTSNENGNDLGSENLTAQLRRYYSKHLNPSNLPDQSDLAALAAIEVAKDCFDSKLQEGFCRALEELEHLGYPGFSDPKILISSKLNPVDTLKHEAAVMFRLLADDETGQVVKNFLPEKYNGLGYQNLISMAFKLIGYRDAWMRVGKAGKQLGNYDTPFELLHLVLVEEPEAHLHAQVQQVFIKKAYETLRDHADLRKSSVFSTQLVVSTHSSYIAHEVNFDRLRYFRRTPASSKTDVPTATVVNLTDTFGSIDDTTRFVARYLKTTHCDLFFANAVILAEGSAERMLLPQFIRQNFPQLNSSYITILDIGGSHAHRLRNLVETLGIITLVITDIDSKDSRTKEKVRPARGANQHTSNDTLKLWIPKVKEVDKLLAVKPEKRLPVDSNIAVAYQLPFRVEVGDSQEEALAYTFEDALVLSNLDLFRRSTKWKGLTGKMHDAANMPTLQDACNEMFECLRTGEKAAMALDLLLLDDKDTLEPPEYIMDGLRWLEKALKRESVETIAGDSGGVR